MTDPLALAMNDRLKEIFEEEIWAFEYQDSIHPPDSNQILFTGSSSIKLWKTLERDMTPLPVLNRGFGGSITEQVVYYAPRIIKPYKPKLIVLYVGENDIANDKVPAKRPFISFVKLKLYLDKHLPNTHLMYIAMKPSPRRWEWQKKFDTANDLIREYIEKQPNMSYIDVKGAMLDESGRVRGDIFVSDSLHMNKKGYRIWTNIIKPEVMHFYGSELDSE